MQKIQSYLYPNRITIIADLAGFTTEYRKVYARTVKIYGGIDNTIQFEVLNADQKRIDITGYAELNMNIMDYSNNAVATYPITPLSTTGLGTVTLLSDDFADLDLQKFKYTITGYNTTNGDVLFYTDTQFNAVGTLDYVGEALPTIRDEITYKDFTAEIDLQGQPIWHSSSIPAKFYEAVKTETLNFQIHVTNFTGTVWLDATEQDTISVEAFRAAGRPYGSWSPGATSFTGFIPFGSNVTVGNYAYFRVSYQSSINMGTGAIFTIDKANNTYTSITILQGGTNYVGGGQILVPGSQLGGLDGVNDAVITVTSIASIGSSYTMSSITSASVAGTASAGSGRYQVTGSNYAGTVDSVTVS